MIVAVKLSLSRVILLPGLRYHHSHQGESDSRSPSCLAEQKDVKIELEVVLLPQMVVASGLGQIDAYEKELMIERDLLDGGSC
ncbi:hypothetical protein MRB53_042050 [Persea americana]|nr:hypothetical protein MRB53_042050 [Persea americana]